MQANEEIRTERLLLRKPQSGDAEQIFRRYSGDRSIGRYLAWPIHKSVEDTKAFLEFGQSEWERWPAGPYLIYSLQDKRLLGSTGLSFETPWRASTGYVIAKDSWGVGFATEALAAIKKTAVEVGVRRLFAYCHPDHQPSRRVLEKCEFSLEGTLRKYCEFPNLSPGEELDVVSYSWIAEPE